MKCLTRLRALIPEEIFLVILLIWFFQVKCSSIAGPRDSVVWTFFIFLSFTKTFKSFFSKVASLWREPMTINSVFAMLRLNLLDVNQVFKLINSMFIVSSNSVRSRLWKVIYWCHQRTFSPDRMYCCNSNLPAYLDNDFVHVNIRHVAGLPVVI